MITKVPAGQFKAKCLALLDEVADHRIELVVTKRGKPVAKLVSIATEKPRLIGRMAGSIQITGDIVSATGETWDAEK
ncbi:MAG: type II toxin-antitoxin system Phd/YefM family antitoxin [Bryobacteraceae bacterium]